MKGFQLTKIKKHESATKAIRNVGFSAKLKVNEYQQIYR